MNKRKAILVRLDEAVHGALARWAAEEQRSTNAQIEFLLRRALVNGGLLPARIRVSRGRGRPRRVSPPDSPSPGGDPGLADGASRARSG
jgi:hypothetical protein